MKVKNYKITMHTYFKAHFRYFKSIFPSYIRVDGKTARSTEILVNS